MGMTSAGNLNPRGRERPLRHQVSDLEAQLMLRRRQLRARVEAISRQLVSQATALPMLLAAAGVGAAIEQTRHRGWSIATMLRAVDAGLALLLSLSALVQQTTRPAPQPGP